MAQALARILHCRTMISKRHLEVDARDSPKFVEQHAAGYTGLEDAEKLKCVSIIYTRPTA